MAQTGKREFEVYKAIMSFPNFLGAGSDKVVSQVFKDLISKSNAPGHNFLKPISKLTF